MKEISTGVWVGSQDDFVALGEEAEGWLFVHACKEPHHRQALGYSGRAAPKEHPEYLVAIRDHRVMLNIIDVDDPKFIRAELIDAALAHMRAASATGANVLCHCNEGKSRGPTIGLIYLAPVLPEDFEQAEAIYRLLVPDYAPRNGVREFARASWGSYRAQGAEAGAPDKDAFDARVADATKEQDIAAAC